MKAAPSFAQVLQQFLEQNSSEETTVPTSDSSAHNLKYSPASETKSPAMDPIIFDWNSIVKARMPSAYSQPKMTNDTPSQAHLRSNISSETSMKNRASATSEPAWPVENLSPAARLALEHLTMTGSSVSLSAVKKVYRRLARRFHPDAGVSANSEAFLTIQEAFEILTRELEQLGKKSA
jgi:DnaJ domain